LSTKSNIWQYHPLLPVKRNLYATTFLDNKKPRRTRGGKPPGYMKGVLWRTIYFIYTT